MSSARHQLTASAVTEIIADLTNRGGLENAWDEIDSDTQEEIKAEWRRIVGNALDRYKANIV